jgi:hypothetical protein
MMFRCEVLNKTRMGSLVKPDDLSYGMVMGECEAMVR